MKFEAIIGLEVHVQLKTRSKAFCGCSTEFGREPNTQVCPVCLGFPGSLPVLNDTALAHAVKVGLALGCKVQEFTKFDRKHYYYPDLPKNYQISQYDLPVCTDGFLTIEALAASRRIGIRRVHLEEDAGKLIHRQSDSMVDFNRAGIPLLEIVSEPHLYSPQEAYDYLTSLKSILKYLDISDCDMEKGSLRCDANVSLREKGETLLGVKTELKNMNSFKAVRDALAYEIERQRGLLEEGKKVIQDTRLWNEKDGVTVSMRTKEEAKDYRYFPEPDLPPFFIALSRIEEIQKTIPELPKEKKPRFMREYGLSAPDASMLVSSRQAAEFAQECLQSYPAKDKKLLANWLIGPLTQEANSRGCELNDLKIKPQALIELIGFVERGEISNLSAKAVLGEMLSSGKSAPAIIAERNMAQISDAGSLERIIEEVIREHEKSVADFKAGKTNALMFLVGQAMRKSLGKANPKVLGELLRGRIEHG